MSSPTSVERFPCQRMSGFASSRWMAPGEITPLK